MNKKFSKYIYPMKTPLAFLAMLVVAYIVYMLCRIVYFLENISTFSDTLEDNSLWDLLSGSLLFDTAAIMYTNSLLALILLLPYPILWRKTIALWFFTIINSLAIVTNFADAVYFKFTGRRTTTTVFDEFSHDSNMGSIIGHEVIGHWYLFLIGIILIIGIWFTARYILDKLLQAEDGKWKKKNLPFHIINLLSILVFIPFCVAGIRGGWTKAVRPIAISNATQYVAHPTEAALVLNTPFSIIRTIGKNVFQDPKYFSDKELNEIYSPVHNDDDDVNPNVNANQSSSTSKSKNVVILIVESFGREYIGAYNENLDGGKYKGYTPFIDKLYKECLSFDYTFANGRKSIDGMPSILSGIPSFVSPFFVTPAAQNDVSGIAGELGKIGYTSAFFHGAENGSMGFEAFAKKTGFQKYYGRTEFYEDKRFDGDKSFDGTWAIWDEPFLQFYALKMTEMKEPFVTAVFTASSHHPFNIPAEYKSRFDIPGDKNPIHKCIQYTDYALQKFFETASRQPWFKNTIFVITSDHTNILDHKEYGTDLGLFGGPILIYDPSGEMPRGRMHCIAQQTDIMPTILGYLGYKKPYISWGEDLLTTKAEDTWAVSYNNGVYQFVKGDYFIQFDGQKLKAVYNFKNDWMLQHNLLSTHGKDKTIMAYERQLKAIIQSYMQRMTQNSLVIK